jgi:hypothetical protein
MVSPARIPPSQWRPVSASAVELDYYGIPARPADPSALQAWLTEWTDYSGFASPEGNCLFDHPIGSTAVISIDPDAVAADPTVVTSNPGPLLTSPGIALADPTILTSEPLGLLTDSSQAAASSNWAGVIANVRGNYTETYGSITQPTQTYCPGPTSSSHSSWVGIGGLGSDHALIQNGTVQYGSPAVTVAFWESISPTGGVDVQGGNTAFPVSAGDQVNVSTTYTPTRISYGFHNLSTGQVWGYPFYGVNHVPPPAFYDGTSAEVIDERATNSTTHVIDELRQFSPASWSAARVAWGAGALTAIRSVPHYGLLMKQSGPSGSKTMTTLAHPVGGAAPDTFTDHWDACGRNGP